MTCIDTCQMSFSPKKNPSPYTYKRYLRKPVRRTPCILNVKNQPLNIRLNIPPARLLAMPPEYMALEARLEAWLNLSQREKASVFVIVRMRAMTRDWGKRCLLARVSLTCQTQTPPSHCKSPSSSIHSQSFPNLPPCRFPPSPPFSPKAPTLKEEENPTKLTNQTQPNRILQPHHSKNR